MISSFFRQGEVRARNRIQKKKKQRDSSDLSKNQIIEVEHGIKRGEQVPQAETHNSGAGSSKEGHSRGGGDEGPPARGLGQVPEPRARVGRLGAAAGGGAVGQRPVDEDGLGAVDVADGHEASVEGIVGAVADDAVDVGLVVVVVAAADLVGVARAGDGLGLVLVRGLVAVVPGAGVGVEVGRVVPDARPEGVGGEPADEDEGDYAAGRAGAGAVGDGGAAAVVPAAAVRGCRARAGRCSAAGGRGRGCGAAATWKTDVLVIWTLAVEFCRKRILFLCLP